MLEKLIVARGRLSCIETFAELIIDQLQEEREILARGPGEAVIEALPGWIDNVIGRFDAIRYAARPDGSSETPDVDALFRRIVDKAKGNRGTDSAGRDEEAN